LDDGHIAVAGVLRFGGQPGADSAVHVLSNEALELTRSFGPLPVVANPDVLQFWGAGGLSLLPNGDLLFVRRIPYEIYQYTPAGTLRGVLRPPLTQRGTPDDAFDLAYEGRGMRVRPLPADSVEILSPLRAISLGDGWILGGHRVGEVRYLDLFSPDGQYAGSRAMMPEWGPVIGFDSSRGVLWLGGHDDMEPVLWRLSIVLERGQ
jgi:hypothetical protein